MKPEQIRQGATYDFGFTLSGTMLSGFTPTFHVMQFPLDTPAITRALVLEKSEFIGVLTSAETDALAVGQWFIYPVIADADEDIREPKKLYISKGWT